MPEVPTFDELYELGKNEITARNPALTDFNDGSNLDAVNGGGAALADQVMGYVLALFAAQFVDTASGSELDALALDRFGLVRNPATAAVGVIRFTRGMSTAALLIPAGAVVEAEVEGEKITFTTDSAATIAVGSTFVDAEATATETGRAGNVAENAADNLLTTITGDPTVTATNTARFAGGNSEESDETFRDRIRRFFQTLRKGTIAALVAGSLTVAGVVFAAVDEAFIAPDDGGYVAVYIGDPEGTGNATLAALVQAELDSNWRVAGIEVRVFASEREEVPLAITITVVKGSDQTTLADAVRASVLGYTDNLEPNELFYSSKAESRAHRVDSDAIRGVVVTTPATATLAPTAPQKAIRVLSAAISLTFVEE